MGVGVEVGVGVGVGVGVKVGVGMGVMGAGVRAGVAAAVGVWQLQQQNPGKQVENGLFRGQKKRKFFSNAVGNPTLIVE